MSCCFGAGIDVDTPFHTILNVDTKIMLQRRHFQECFLVVGTVSAFSFRFARGFHHGTLLRMEAQGPPLLLNGKGVQVFLFEFSAALRPQRPSGLLGTGSPGRPPPLSHSS